tara:strand:+ start:97 stop:696 length:600 start_codon:yes stop_codon:yes gene_type:complete
MISSIILAAGMSKRMIIGNKLLLEYKDKSILENTIINLTSSNVSEIVVVLGHDFSSTSKILKSTTFKIINNTNYLKGMSTSIVAGVKLINLSSKGVMVCLADMPLIKVSTYNKLINKFNKANDTKKIIIPTYKKQEGNPILFGKYYFNFLLKLKGDKGARDLIKDKKDSVILVDVDDEGIVKDIDNYKDYEYLKKINYE